MPAENPLFVDSDLPLGMPRFDLIRDEHFGPAFDRGMAEQREEIRAIADGTDAPTFENTIVAMERSGRLLGRVRAIFDNLTAAHTNDTLEALRSDLAPKLAAHRDAIALDAGLFARIDAVYGERGRLELDEESMRLVDRYHKDFVRSGARLSAADKKRLRQINAELAELATTFSQNVRNEVNASGIVVASREDLAGLSEAAIATASRAAESRGLDGKYLIPLMNTTGQPVLAHLESRPLRRRIFEASVARGSRGGEFDNREVASRMLKLRAERARMLGYENHATYVLADETARTPEAVSQRLAELAPPAIANARRESDTLQDMISAEGGDFRLEPWDWAYYTEKVRRAEYDFDENELRPYLEMGNVLERGVFYAAQRLFGLSFHERHDLPTYHPTVRVFEVHDADGELIAIFLADLYARPSKRGGAWEDTYVSQSRLLGDKVVAANHLNVPEPKEGDPTLLTFDEVVTLFHEFGHALHAMLSDVTYPRFSGTSVPDDFVEFPSQANEMWAIWPEVVESYAVHHETGEPMPRELVDKVLALRSFNQGFKTSEYLRGGPGGSGASSARAGRGARRGDDHAVRGRRAGEGGGRVPPGPASVSDPLLFPRLQQLLGGILLLHLG